MPKQAKERVRDQKPKGDTLTRNLVLGMVGFVILILGVFTVLDRQSGSSAESPLAIENLDTSSLGEPLVGTVSETNDYGIVFNPDATLQIDIWEDFQCPYCNFFEKANGSYVDELIRSKEAKVVYHMASFLGQESVRASNASYCAVEEGRFLDFHKAIYNVQGAENSGLFSNKNLITIGEKLGITSQSFKDCVNNNEFGDTVKKVAESMPKNKVQGTPTIFINGKLWERKSNDFSVAEFKAAVEAAK
ncbi:MAG: DsbA family protein [Actinomycetota bacterium]